MSIERIIGENMKKFLERLILMLIVVIVLSPSLSAQAKEKDVVADGVFVETVDISGMTKDEAIQAVDLYMEEVKQREIKLEMTGEDSVVVLAEDIGVEWDNPEIVREALLLGKTGNIIQRYKTKKDLEKENRVYEIELIIDRDRTNQILSEQSENFDEKLIEASLTRVDGEFVFKEGKNGFAISLNESFDAVEEFVESEWDIASNGAIQLVTKIEEIKGTKEELDKVQEVLGSYGTAFSSSANRTGNIISATGYINGTVIYPGEEFSTNAIMRYPFTVEDGFYSAGSYLNGTTVSSMGGGVCQVSTTLYNALLLSELEIVERNNHSMTVGYVPLSADAMVSGGVRDLKFINNTDAPIYIEGYVSNRRKLDFIIYGEETRPDNRVVTYESELIEKRNPGPEQIIADPSLPVGVSSVQRGRIGYKAKLWKVVTVDGVEVSRTEENTSSYASVTRKATIGVASANPAAVNEVTIAINTGVIDHAVAVSNAWAAAIAADNAAVAAAAAAATPPPVTP